MFEKLNTIELSGKEYPIKCDLCVLEELQEEFGDLEIFESKLLGIRKVKNEDGSERQERKMPDMKAINTALYWMVREGMEIQAEKNGDAEALPSKKEFLRMVDGPFLELAGTIYKEFLNCFVSKNTETTQRETEDQENQ